jgi:PTH1 family peptidyl-tRNA hydrolase
MEGDIRPRIRVIAGLGNPGRDFERTRHNLGFEVVDFLKGKAEFVGGEGDYHRCDTVVSSVKIVLLKPTTYMNRSGAAIRQVVETEDLSPEEVLVIADDFNLPLGKIRLRRSGSDGGHNGLASIIYHLGTEDFARIRLGIGPVPEGVPAEEFVLERFKKSEVASAKNMVERAAKAVSTWLEEGFEKSASKFNPAPDDI